MSEKGNYNDITMFDIIKAVFSKWKRLLCILLAALMIFGAIGAGMSILMSRTYGTQLQFYITSEKANESILSIVQSDLFIEELFMDENGLPAPFKGEEDYKKADEMIKKIATLKEENEELEFTMANEHWPRRVSLAKRKADDIQAKKDEIQALLKSMHTSIDVESYREKIMSIQAEYDKLDKEWQEAHDYYREINDLQEDMKEKISDNNRTIKLIREELDPLKASLIERFKKLDNIEKDMRKVKDSIIFSCEEKESIASRVVFFADIAVVGDEELAEMVVTNLPEKLAAFIEDNGDESVECLYISTISTVQEIDSPSMLSLVIKYGIIGSAGVFVIYACVIAFKCFYEEDKKRKEAMNKLDTDVL